MRDLRCKRIQADQIWGFVGKKDKNLCVDDPEELGNAWVFVALDAETKLIPSYTAGKRDHATTYAFLSDLREKNLIAALPLRPVETPCPYSDSLLLIAALQPNLPT